MQYSNSTDIDRYDKLVEEKEGSLRYAEWYYGPQKRIFISPQLKIFPEKRFLNSGKVIAAFQKVEESRVKRLFGSLTRNSQIEKVNVWSINGDFEFNLKEVHSFSYGFEATYNDIHSRAFQSDLIVNDSSIIGFTPSLPIPTRYPSGGSTYASFAIFLNWVWDVNEKLTVNAGARLTNTKLNGRWKEYYNINSLLSTVNLDAAALTETLAVTYRPKEKKQWNFIISNGFRNPNIDDVGKIRESKGLLVVPNPSLFPEYAYNFEVGLTNYFSQPKNYISFRGFTTLLSRHIGRNDYVIFSDTTTDNLNTIIYNGEEVTTLANNNLGNRLLYGASIDGYINLTKSLSIQGNLSYIQSMKSEKYGPLPSISPTFGNLMLKYQKNKWLTNLQFQFSGKKDPNQYSLGGEDGLEETPLIPRSMEFYAGTPAWNDLSFQTQFHYSKNLNFRFGLDNIFDVHYRTFSSGISVPGRNLRLGVNLRL